MMWDELLRHGEVEVPSDSEATVHDIVSQVISEQRPELVGVEPQIDAPPFSADWWWLATVRREGDMATVMPFEPAAAFGIDEQGLVHFQDPQEMPLRYLARQSRKVTTRPRRTFLSSRDLESSVGTGSRSRRWSSGSCRSSQPFCLVSASIG